jgi:hypothetical protein
MVQRLSGPDAARRRYALIQTVIAVAFAGAMLGATALISRAESEMWRWCIAAIPLVVLGLWAREFHRLVRDGDEMMQAAYLRLTAISGLVVLFVATAWGLLEQLVGLPALPGFLLLPAFAACYGVASVFFPGRA